MDDPKQPPLNKMPFTVFGQNLTGKCLEEDIDLNDALQAALKNSSEDLLILRSDKLPSVWGMKRQMLQLFEALTAMILNHPPRNSKLFLYVQCKPEEIDPEVIDLRLTPGHNIFHLYFFSNITTDNDWQLIYRDQLARCELIAREFKGSFVFHPISNTGCLFSLTLPGKFN